MVTLKSERIGNQLQNASDVKIRGLIVGEVRSITSTGDGASIEMALQPDQVAGIPVNVSARILPKTLFGERFVDLVIPTDPSATTIAAGDTIGQDRSTVAIELEQVFDNPASAGTTERERAIARFAQAVTLRPQSLGADDIAPLRVLGMRDEEILDLLHASAIFGWANRLMHNLGEPVHPVAATGA